jgi:hypothetical protein
MWYWKRMEKMIWNDHVRNVFLLRGKEEKNILHTIKGRNANGIGHILLRNCIPKYLIEGEIEGRIEVAEKRGRKRKQLLDDPKKTNTVK